MSKKQSTGVRSLKEIGEFAEKEGLIKGVEKTPDVIFDDFKREAERNIVAIEASGKNMLEGVIIQGGAPDDEKEARNVIADSGREIKKEKENLDKKIKNIRRKIGYSEKLIEKTNNPGTKEKHKNIAEGLRKELHYLTTEELTSESAKNILEDAISHSRKSGFEETEEKRKEMESEIKKKEEEKKQKNTVNKDRKGKNVPKKEKNKEKKDVSGKKRDWGFKRLVYEKFREILRSEKRTMEERKINIVVGNYLNSSSGKEFSSNDKVGDKLEECEATLNKIIPVLIDKYFEEKEKRRGGGAKEKEAELKAALTDDEQKILFGAFDDPKKDIGGKKQGATSIKNTPSGLKIGYQAYVYKEFDKLKNLLDQAQADLNSEKDRSKKKELEKKIEKYKKEIRNIEKIKNTILTNIYRTKLDKFINSKLKGNKEHLDLYKMKRLLDKEHLTVLDEIKNEIKDREDADFSKLDRIIDSIISSHKADKKTGKEKSLGELSVYVDKNNRDESIECLSEIAAAKDRLSVIFNSIDDDGLKKEIIDFVRNYTEKELKTKETGAFDGYENQKKFLELSRVLFAEIENKIKSFGKKQVDQEDDFRESHDVSESTPDPEGESLTDRDIELQTLRRKKEEIERELEEVEEANSDGVRLMRLQKELADIEKEMQAVEKGEEISEEKYLTPEDEKQFQKEIERMPPKEQEKLGFGLRNMGFFAREFKSKKLAELCEFASKKSKGNKFLAALAETYRKDEGGARKQIEDSNKKVKGVQQLQNVGYITGGALKWGRNVADVVGWTAGSPLRWVTLGAQFFSRGAEAAKEARFKNEKIINKTRIKDVDKAADQAWVLYEQAKAQAVQGGVVSSELLGRAYLENLPQDLLDRLKNPEPGVATGFVQSLLKKDLEWAIKKGKITKKSFELFLKDCDRLIGEYGEVDTVALGAKYAQTAGKAVIAGVAVESIALLVQKAIHEAPGILSRLDGIWDGKEPELPKSPYSSEMEISQSERAPDALGIKEGAGQMQEFGYQGGKSIWQEAEKQLAKRIDFHAFDSESMEVLKTLNIDKVKDVVVENPVKYGLSETDDLDVLSADKLQGIKWNLVFDNLKAENAFVSEADGAIGDKILSNNEALRTFFAEHPDAPRTSENYEDILQGKGITGEKEISYDFGVNAKPETPYSDLMDATQNRLAFQNIVKDKSINIEWAEKAGIKIEDGINGSERIKLYFLNDNKFNTAEDAKEFFELSEKINVDYHQSAFKEAFARLPEDFTSDQKAGYMKIFAGGNVQEGVKDLLDMEGAHAKGVVIRGNVIEVNDLIYNGKRMDIFISKDGKIGVDGEGIRLAVERKWLGLGRPKPTMKIDGDTIAMIRERIKSVLGKNKG